MGNLSQTSSRLNVFVQVSSINPNVASFKSHIDKMKKFLATVASWLLENKRKKNSFAK